MLQEIRTKHYKIIPFPLTQNEIGTLPHFYGHYLQYKSYDKITNFVNTPLLIDVIIKNTEDGKSNIKSPEKEK